MEAKRTYWTVRDACRRFTQRGRDAAYVRSYELGADDMRAWQSIVENLGLAVPADQVFARLRWCMTKTDLENLLALLRFVQQHLLAARGTPGGGILRSTQLPELPSRRRNILFISGQFPNPLHGGGVRVADFIKVMSRKHDVYLYAPCDRTRDHRAYLSLVPYCRKIRAARLDDFGASRSIRELVAHTEMDVVHYEWPRSVALYDPSWGRHHIYTYMEVVSLRLLRDAAHQRPWSQAWLRTVVDLLNSLKAELADTDAMDAHIVVAERDGEFLARFAPDRSFVVLNHGVNLEEYSVPDSPPEEQTIVFVGNYLHYPNEDAVRFFVEESFDYVARCLPGVRLYLVGANPTRRIRAYADGRRVFVTGTVADIRPWIQRASVCIAPLVTGAGLRTKVIQYAALRRVCVATSIAAADLLFKDGVDILVADDPLQFAERVVYLLRHPEIARRMGQAAHRRVILEYDNSRLLEGLYRLHAGLERGGLRPREELHRDGERALGVARRSMGGSVERTALGGEEAKGSA